MLLEHQTSIVWLMKNHVKLKTGEITQKIQLCITGTISHFHCGPKVLYVLLNFLN